jgi:gamma-glutamylcyclotransferase (GGCT)/AIG2-like uncharacterized protein YtfP
MKNILIIILTFTVLSGCTSRKKNNENIVNCINNFIEERSNENYQAYFNNIKVLEDDLIRSNLLENRTKEAYLKMIDKFEENPMLFKKFADIEKYFHSSDFPIIAHQFHYCIYKETGKNRKSAYMHQLLSDIESFELEKDLKYLKNLIKNLDFEHEEIRLIVCGYIEMVFMEMFYKDFPRINRYK